MPQWARFFGSLHIGFGAHTTPCKIGAGSLSRGKSGRDVALTTHLNLAPRLKKEQSYTSPPLGLHGLFEGESCSSEMVLSRCRKLKFTNRSCLSKKDCPCYYVVKLIVFSICCIFQLFSQRRKRNVVTAVLDFPLLQNYAKLDVRFLTFTFLGCIFSHLSVTFIRNLPTVTTHSATEHFGRCLFLSSGEVTLVSRQISHHRTSI